MCSYCMASEMPIEAIHEQQPPHNRLGQKKILFRNIF